MPPVAGAVTTGMLVVVLPGNAVPAGICWMPPMVAPAGMPVWPAAATLAAPVRVATLPRVFNPAGPLLTRAEPSKPPTVELRWQPDDNKPTSARPAKTWTGFVPIVGPLPRKHLFSRRADARARRAPGFRHFSCAEVGQAAQKWGGP